MSTLLYMTNMYGDDYLIDFLSNPLVEKKGFIASGAVAHYKNQKHS